MRRVVGALVFVAAILAIGAVWGINLLSGLVSGNPDPTAVEPKRAFLWGVAAVIEGIVDADTPKTTIAQQDEVTATHVFWGMTSPGHGGGVFGGQARGLFQCKPCAEGSLGHSI